MSDAPSGIDDVTKNAKKELALNAGRAVVDDMKKRVEDAPTNTKLKILGAVVGIGVLGIAVLALIAKLWLWAVGLVLVGGVGFATYTVVKPRLAALKKSAEDKLLAGQREREEQERVLAAANAEAHKKKKLEDELAALKQKAGS